MLQAQAAQRVMVSLAKFQPTELSSRGRPHPAIPLPANHASLLLRPWRLEAPQERIRRRGRPTNEMQHLVIAMS